MKSDYQGMQNLYFLKNFHKTHFTTPVFAGNQVINTCITIQCDKDWVVLFGMIYNKRKYIVFINHTKQGRRKKRPVSKPARSNFRKT